MTGNKICPHCNKADVRRGHIAHCPENPTARAAALVALADPNKPGRGVSRTFYDIRRQAKAPGAPSSTALRERFGSWDAVCAAFALLPPKRANARDEGESQPPKRICPHCGRKFYYFRHLDECPARPDRLAAARALAESDTPGAAVDYNEYLLRVREARARDDKSAPGGQALRDLYGTWADAVAAMGLLTQEQAEEQWMRDEAEEARAAVEAERNRQRGLEYCRVRTLPDGRVAYLLR